MLNRSWVAVFGCTVLFACGEGGGSSQGSSLGSERPPSTGEQAPPSNSQDPVPSGERPVTNDQQAPVNAQQPLPPASVSSAQGSGGKPGDGPPGKKCSVDDQCAGCKNACQLCECSGLTHAECVSTQICK